MTLRVNATERIKEINYKSWKCAESVYIGYSYSNLSYVFTSISQFVEY